MILVTEKAEIMKLRSLFLAMAGALVLTTAFAPRANADTLLIYFNFEDGAVPNPPSPGSVDINSDQVAGTLGGPPGDVNPGGGIQFQTLTINYGPLPGTPLGDFSSTSSLIPIGTTNQSAGDIDVPPATPGLALGLTKSMSHNGSYIQFNVDATFFANMSLSYAVNTNGNGFKTQTFQYSITPGHADASFVQFAQFTNLTGKQTLSAALPTLVNQNPNLAIRIVFSDGQSNGNDLQTIIDNIQLTGTVIPEPATVMGGLLGVCGLCWHQRRRLIGLLRLRRA